MECVLLAGYLNWFSFGYIGKTTQTYYRCGWVGGGRRYWQKNYSQVATSTLGRGGVQWYIGGDMKGTWRGDMNGLCGRVNLASLLYNLTCLWLIDQNMFTL